MDGLQPHIRCRAGDVAPFVLLPGDPGRISAIAAHLDSCQEVGDLVAAVGAVREEGASAKP